MAQFERYIGIDYSGAETPTSSLPGLRIYAADGTSPPEEILAPQSQQKYWTRKGVAERLQDELSGPKSIIVGIDHAFSFPARYFEEHDLRLDWSAFLDDFQRHWPTDQDNAKVSVFRSGGSRMGEPSWLRLTELWTPAAKSVFQFDVQGQVATSTHAPHANSSKPGVISGRADLRYYFQLADNSGSLSHRILPFLLFASNFTCCATEEPGLVQFREYGEGERCE